MFTRHAPGPTNAPFAVRQDAYPSHPGRPLEPQQMNNLRAAKPVGSMRDQEAIPHSSKGATSSSTKSADATNRALRICSLLDGVQGRGGVN